MVSVAEKHNSVVEESVARLISRSANPRGLKPEDIFPRISQMLNKYYPETKEHHELREAVDSINADDLCLIVACENGDESAWSDLVAAYDSTVKQAARKISANSEDAEDLAGSIWAELYGLKERDGRAHGKISYYSGRGSLAGWLRAVVNQLAVDQFRKIQRFVQIEENREFENLANESAERNDSGYAMAASENPEDLFSEKEAIKNVSLALQKAMGEMAAEDRLLLKLYYFDNLKLKDIGASLGFHEATASRKLVRTQSDLRKSVEKILQAENGWNAEEVKSHLAETAQKLGINLEQIFASMIFLFFLQEAVKAAVL